jgi:NAD-dependent deacetylase
MHFPSQEVAMESESAITTARTWRADTVLVAVTSAVVEPAASLPLLGKENGVRLIEVNPEATPLSGEADTSLRGTSSGVLPALIP